MVFPRHLFALAAGRLQTRKHRDGFTAMEALMAIVIVAVVAALAFPVLAWVGRITKGTDCVSRLYKAGTAMQLYIQDMNGRIVTRSGGSRGGIADMWSCELAGRGYLSEPARPDGYRSRTGEDPKHLRCPAGALPATADLSNWGWYTYGLNLFTPGGKEEKVDGTPTHIRYVTDITAPAAFPLLADSASASLVQTFRISLESGGLALRHQGKGNVLFLDGHVEAIDRPRAQALGFPAIYNVEP